MGGGGQKVNFVINNHKVGVKVRFLEMNTTWKQICEGEFAFILYNYLTFSNMKYSLTLHNQHLHLLLHAVEGHVLQGPVPVVVMTLRQRTRIEKPNIEIGQEKEIIQEKVIPFCTQKNWKLNEHKQKIEKFVCRTCHEIILKVNGQMHPYNKVYGKKLKTAYKMLSEVLNMWVCRPNYNQPS